MGLRVSRTIDVGRVGHAELLLDVLNALNDTAEEGIASDNLFGTTSEMVLPIPGDLLI